MTSATTPDRYRPHVAQRSSDDSAAAILDAARELLSSEGQGALTVRRIAAAAGGSTMNVYSRFGGKDGVIDALLIEGFEKLTEVIVAAYSRASATDDLMTCALAYREFALAYRTHYELMFDRAIRGYQMSDAAVAAAMASLGSLASRIQYEMDKGNIRQGDAMETATIFWAACHGPVSLELRMAGKSIADWTEVHRRLAEAVIAGLRPDARRAAANKR